MPTYEYHCPANNQSLEVRHGMTHTVKNWGELCELAGHDAGQTAVNSPVQRAVTAGYVATSGTGAPAHTCGSPKCCRL